MRRALESNQKQILSARSKLAVCPYHHQGSLSNFGWLMGYDPMTYRVTIYCSTNWAIATMFNWAVDRNRTDVSLRLGKAMCTSNYTTTANRATDGSRTHVPGLEGEYNKPLYDSRNLLFNILYRWSESNWYVNQLTFLRLMRARVYNGMIKAADFHGTSYPIVGMLVSEY